MFRTEKPSSGLVMFLKWKHHIPFPLSHSPDSVQPLWKEISVRKLYTFILLVWLLRNGFFFFFFCSQYWKMYFCHWPVRQQLKFIDTLPLYEGLYCFHNMYQICQRKSNLDQNQSWLSRRNREHQSAYSRKAGWVKLGVWWWGRGASTSC